MSEDLYYYAGGDRIPLELDQQHVAIDIGSIESVKLRGEIATLLAQTAETGASKPLRSKLHLADEAEVPEPLLARLRAAGALQPVFRCGKTLMIALPEVRIEVETRKAGSSIEPMFRKDGPDVEIVRDRGTELTIRPMSGSGLDALHLANEVEEMVAPVMAQVRFLRVAPRP